MTQPCRHPLLQTANQLCLQELLCLKSQAPQNTLSRFNCSQLIPCPDSLFTPGSWKVCALFRRSRPTVSQAPPPLQCHALRHRKPPTTSRHIRSHADSYRWLLGSCWAEKRQDQEFPGPRPPRHSTNLRVCICRDGWPSSVPGEAGSGGAGPALLTTEQSWKAGGFVQFPQHRDITSSPAVLPKALQQHHKPAGLGAVWPLCVRHAHN